MVLDIELYKEYYSDFKPKQVHQTRTSGVCRPTRYLTFCLTNIQPNVKHNISYLYEVIVCTGFDDDSFICVEGRNAWCFFSLDCMQADVCFITGYILLESSHHFTDGRFSIREDGANNKFQPNIVNRNKQSEED